MQKNYQIKIGSHEGFINKLSAVHVSLVRLVKVRLCCARLGQAMLSCPDRNANIVLTFHWSNLLNLLILMTVARNPQVLLQSTDSTYRPYQKPQSEAAGPTDSLCIANDQRPPGKTFS